MQKFQVKAIAKTPNPQQLIYLAMHQDYSEDYVGALENIPSEEKCGEIIVSRLLAGDRGHYGPLEHPQITFSCGYFPHSVIQQARTHRIGVSFDVQSFRYTGVELAKLGQRIRQESISYQSLTDCLLQTPELTEEIENYIYLRPVGKYSDRSGKHYEYSQGGREDDLIELARSIIPYSRKILASGYSEEHARGMLPFDYRQHFVVSFNLRSFLHFCDLRNKKDAQLEIQKLCELMWADFEDWAPAIAGWYKRQRLGKGRLAP